MSQNVSTAVMQRRHEAPDSLDYFPPPPWATRAFLRETLQTFRNRCGFHNVWEPACGEGHMVNVLQEFSSNVLASDVHDYGKGHAVGSYVGQGSDVMPPWPECDWVVTNPPFNLAVEFAERSLDEARVGVALLVRSAFAEGGERFNRLFRDQRPTFIAQYCDRVPMVKGRYDPKASSATSYAWFVWIKDGHYRRLLNSSTRFRWIEPGAKERNLHPSDLRRWAA